ncbi:MAG TPA: SBBP repeat-containing protein [Terriglobia bacterium]|nr:SBBP repeat-containing protein [Terriglobia bacterium]
MRRVWIAGLVGLCAAAAGLLTFPIAPPHARKASQSVAFGVPLYFEANRGQAADDVEFLAVGSRGVLYLTNQEAVFALRPEKDPRPGSISWVRMRFAGANPAAQILGEQKLPGRSHYFVGNNPAKWRTDVPQYARVRYREVYPGIDLVFYGNGGALEYDFLVAPGADPRQISVQLAGAEGELDAHGNLLLRTAAGLLVQRAPAIYQEVAGTRKRVAGGYVLGSQGRVSFRVEDYDRRHALVLDPVVEYARFFGGSKEEEILSMAADKDGNVYLTGETSSPDLPLTSGALPHKPAAFQTQGNTLAFVAKLDPTGTKLIYCTYLGGSKTAVGHNLKIDAAGNAYVGGRTEANDFPLKNPMQAAFGGGSDDGFLTKLNAAGNALVYSTYIGGSEYDQGRALAVDAQGNAYLTGITESANFPTKNPIQAQFGGQQDTFVAKFNAAGNALLYSTYLGGSGNDVGHAIAVDRTGSAYITGLTNSPNFPTANAFQSSFKGGEGNDVIVVKVNAAGSAWAYATFLGGSKNEESRAIEVDAAGNATITGYTQSPDFPTAKALQASFAGGSHDIFLTQFRTDGRALNFSTFLGGSGGDFGRGLALDAAGNIYLTGYTESQNFPLQDAFQQRYAGGTADAFVAKLNPTASELLFSSFLGGSAYERGRAIALGPRGGIHVSGRTESRDFPATRSLTSRFGGGPNDAFLLKLSEQ